MKICQIVASVGQGGLEKHVIELSKYLNKKDGIELTVIAHESFRKELEGINFQAFDLTKSRKNIFLLFKLYKYLKAQNFDIIHTQANKATAMISMLKPFLQSKIVATLHNKKSNLKPFEKVDYVITVSNKIGEKVKNNKTTVYNGINYSKKGLEKVDLYDKYKIERNDFIICSVARFTKVKRFDLLIKALEKVKGVHLLLVGSGEEEQNLKVLANKLNVSSKLTFTGRLDNNDVKNLVNSSSLFVMSSDNEGFPYTFIETMFCETPFLSTPVSDLKEFVGNKYIVPFDDFKAISEKIAQIKDNYNETLSDFKNIFEKAQNKLTIEYMSEDTLTIYKKLI